MGFNLDNSQRVPRKKTTKGAQKEKETCAIIVDLQPCCVVEIYCTALVK